MIFNKVSIPAQVMSRQVGEETVILDLTSGTYFGLNPVGSRIWQLLESGRALSDISQVLVQEFDVSAPVIEADIDNLLKDLAQKGLIGLSDPS